jgi:hypothetical protein
MFGSGVLSYFVLLRWLFLINLVVFFVTLFFLVIPQMVFQPSFVNNNSSFTGWEIITGDVSNPLITISDMYGYQSNPVMGCLD